MANVEKYQMITGWELWGSRARARQQHHAVRREKSPQILTFGSIEDETVVGVSFTPRK